MRQVRLITASLTVLLVLLSAGIAGAQGISRARQNPAAQGITAGVGTSRELAGLRTADSDTFLQADGSRLLRIFDRQVNFKRGGSWVPIEDRLVQGSGGAWEPAASPVPVSFPVGLAGRPVRIGPAGRRLSLALQGAEGASGVSTGSERSYSAVRRHVDVGFTATAQSVRETLSLADSEAPSEYSYSLGLDEEMHASLARGGSVRITDAQGKTVYTIAAPTIEDSSTTNHVPWRAPVHYELNAAGTVLTLVVNKAWLSSPSRVYPVKIDPDVYFGAESDCSISTGAYELEEQCGDSLFLGHDSTENATLAGAFALRSVLDPEGV